MNVQIESNEIGGLFGHTSYPDNQIENCMIILDAIGAYSYRDKNTIGGISGGTTNSERNKIKNAYIYVNMIDGKSNNNTFNTIDGNERRYELDNVKYFRQSSMKITEGNNVSKFTSASGCKIYKEYEEFKSLPLSNLGFDESKWEYIDGNCFPTLKGKPFYFISDLNCDENINMPMYENQGISVTVLPEKASLCKLKYKSNDDEIATVDEEGNVIGMKNGTATIIVSTMDGSNISKEITVTVGECINPPVINTYDVDEDKKFINNIIPTTIGHYKENVNIQEPYTIKVYKKGVEQDDDVNIATEMVTKIFFEDKVVAEYINIVPGDFHGVRISDNEWEPDGIIKIIEVTMLKQYLVGMRDIPYGSPRYYACDFDRDGQVRLSDAERIQQYVSEMFELNEEEYYAKSKTRSVAKNELTIESQENVDLGEKIEFVIKGNFEEDVNSVKLRYNLPEGVQMQGFTASGDWTITQNNTDNNTGVIIRLGNTPTKDDINIKGEVELGKLTFIVPDTYNKEEIELQIYGLDATNTDCKAIDFYNSDVSKSVSVITEDNGNEQENPPSDDIDKPSDSENGEDITPSDTQGDSTGQETPGSGIQDNPQSNGTSVDKTEIPKEDSTTVKAPMGQYGSKNTILFIIGGIVIITIAIHRKYKKVKIIK